MTSSAPNSIRGLTSLLRGRPAGLLAGGLAGLLASLLLAGCAGEHTGALRAAPVAAAAPRLSVSERAAQQDHAALVKAFGGEYRAPQLKGLLDEIVARLVPHTARPDQGYEITLLDSPSPNAFAMPSGRIYLTRGLLALGNDSAELAAVMAHEMAHVTRRHALARGELEARSVLVSRVVSDLLGDPAGGTALRERSRATLAGFSRAQEFEADAVGVATLAAAGYDPSAAARFLRSLERNVRLSARHGDAGAPDMLSTHPATAERIALAAAEARRVGSPEAGPASRDAARDAYLDAIDGTLFGDNPADGIVRGRRFLHPRLGVAFEAPAGYALENTPRAVLGVTGDGRRRLLFDAVDLPEGQSLQEVITSTWSDALEPGSLETRRVGDGEVAVARSRGQEWEFRLAAIRIGPTIYRLILASREGDEPLAGEFDAALASVRAFDADEAAALKPDRIRITRVGLGDDLASLAARMTGDAASGSGALDRFLALNGLDQGAVLKVGERYKVVSE